MAEYVGCDAPLVFQMIRDDGLARAERKPGRRFQIGTEAGRTDDAFVPTNSGAHDKFSADANTTLTAWSKVIDE